MYGHPNISTDTLAEVFGQSIYIYTRAQAIEDGVLVDVSETAKEARFPGSGGTDPRSLGRLCGLDRGRQQAPGLPGRGRAALGRALDGLQCRSPGR